MSLILMYHGVGDRPAPGGEPRYTVGRPSFAAQVALLAAERAVVPYPELVAGKAGPDAVTITFDDGDQSLVSEALPVLQEQGLTATLFMTSGWINAEGYLSADDLRRLAAAGWTVGTNGVTHRYRADLPDDELWGELVHSADTVGRILQRPVEHVSLPGGRGSRRVVQAARRAGYQSVATSRPGFNQEPLRRFAVRRTPVPASWGIDHFRRMIRGDPLLQARLLGQQAVLDGAKFVLGNRRYDALRRGALARLGRPFRHPA